VRRQLPGSRFGIECRLCRRQPDNAVWRSANAGAHRPIAGIQNFASNLAGILMTFYFGYAVQHSTSYVLPLSVARVLSIVGALSYLFLVGRIEPLPRIAQARADGRA
jgi:hypothetical protein